MRPESPPRSRRRRSGRARARPRASRPAGASRRALARRRAAWCRRSGRGCPSPASLPRLDGDGVEERHHRAQRRADLLDRLILLGAAAGLELGRAVRDLGDPRLRERAGADVGEQLLHRGLRLGPDLLVAGFVVAPLNKNKNKETQKKKTTTKHEVDDQLELVQALEVRDLG